MLTAVCSALTVVGRFLIFVSVGIVPLILGIGLFILSDGLRPLLLSVALMLYACSKWDIRKGFGAGFS